MVRIYHRMQESAERARIIADARGAFAWTNHSASAHEWAQNADDRARFAERAAGWAWAIMEKAAERYGYMPRPYRLSSRPVRIGMLKS